MSILGSVNLGSSTMKAIYVIAAAFLLGCGMLSCSIEHLARSIRP